MTWPFEPWVPSRAVPPELMVAVIYDQARYTPDGTTFSLLDAVRVFHNLPVEEDKAAIIKPIIKRHELAQRAARKANHEGHQ